MGNTTREKRCSKCQLTKPHNCFHRDRTASDGFDSRCKDCRTNSQKRCNACQLTKSKSKFPSGRRVCETCINEQGTLRSANQKRCSKCKLVRPVNDFSPRGSGNYQYACKDCRNKNRHRYTVDITEKRCSKCQVIKSADEFYRVPTNKHGLNSECKDCQRAAKRNEYDRNGGRRWPDRTATPNRKRDRHLKRKYGVTQQEYDQILIRQNGRCICGVRGTNNTFGLLYVDHNHETGAVRGLLCQHCNQVLGYAKDSPEQLMTLAAYLIANQTNVSAIDLDLRQLKRIGQRFTESMTRLIGFYNEEPMVG